MGWDGGGVGDAGVLGEAVVSGEARGSPQEILRIVRGGLIRPGIRVSTDEERRRVAAQRNRIADTRDGIAGMISMRALECLVTIVEQGSLTQAAAVLHLSQPALSHQIAAIERDLGTPVIERLPRGIRPTAAGLAAAAEARIALAAADRAVTGGQESGGRGRRPDPHRLRGDDDDVGSGSRAARLAAPVPRRRTGPEGVHQRGPNAGCPAGRGDGPGRRAQADADRRAHRRARPRGDRGGRLGGAPVRAWTRCRWPN